MNKSIRLLVESFFDDDIFNIEDDIKTDIEEIGNQYYDYQVGEIIYQNKKPYAICCGEPKYFNDNKPRFCLLEDSGKRFNWRTENKLVKELDRFKIEYFELTSFNDFLHIDENGYENTLIIKNNYDINEFPAFKYCINQGNNVYLPAIDELLIMLLNEVKLGKYCLSSYYYWSSTLHSVALTYYICNSYSTVGTIDKFFSFFVRPFFHL